MNPDGLRYFYELPFQSAFYIVTNDRIVFRHLTADNVKSVIVGTTDDTAF